MTLTDHDIRQEASRHITEYLFPGDTCHTPDVMSMARAEKLDYMLRKRMKELVAAGEDPRGRTLEELLPGVRPDDIELTESDFC